MDFLFRVFRPMPRRLTLIQRVLRILYIVLACLGSYLVSFIKYFPYIVHQLVVGVAFLKLLQCIYHARDAGEDQQEVAEPIQPILRLELPAARIAVPVTERVIPVSAHGSRAGRGDAETQVEKVSPRKPHKKQSRRHRVVKSEE